MSMCCLTYTWTIFFPCFQISLPVYGKNMETNGCCKLRKRRVLVTGGAGYLGSTMVPMLLQRGHHVVVFDKFMWGALPLLPHAANPHLEIVRGDILDKNLLAKHMEDCDVIIHLAAIVGYPACEKFHDEAIQVSDLEREFSMRFKFNLEFLGLLLTSFIG